MKEFDKLRELIRTGHADVVLLRELERAEAEHMEDHGDKEPVDAAPVQEVAPEPVPAPWPAPVQPVVEDHGEAHSEGA